MPEEDKKTENQTEEIKLDRKSKILFVAIAVLIAGSVAVTFWRYMIKKDYIIEAQIDCDPETENCLVWRCDPSSLEEGEKCTGVPDNDIWYYKILRRNAKNIPLCDPKDENCAAYQCEPNEPECEITNCSPESAASDEECSTPEQYLEENPPEEEECAPDDEECLPEEESIECDSEDPADCEEAADEECAPDDEECAADSQEETETPSDSEETSGEINGLQSPAGQNIPPAGAEPM